MNKIVSKEYLSDRVVKFEVEAPLIAKSRRAGHFVIVRVGKKGERVPYTIADADLKKGTITLVIQKVGKSSQKVCELNTGDYITDIVGPLGKGYPHRELRNGRMCGRRCGYRTDAAHHESHERNGKQSDFGTRARTKELIILEEQVREHSDEVIIMTDDGSYGEKGLITNGVEKVILREKVDMCVTIGPAIMMKFVSELTKKYDVPTVASLNTIMVDGTGMCGACRVTVGGQTRFVCVDGPEFDAHQVDFNEMLMRKRRMTGEKLKVESGEDWIF
jgi:ferredoxin--NADP+ reductase